MRPDPGKTEALLLVPWHLPRGPRSKQTARVPMMNRAQASGSSPRLIPPDTVVLPCCGGRIG